MGYWRVSSEMRDKIIDTFEQVVAQRELDEDNLILTDIARETFDHISDDLCPSSKTIQNYFTLSGVGFYSLSEDQKERVLAIREFIDAAPKKTYNSITYKLREEIIDTFEQITCQKELDDKLLIIKEIAEEAIANLDYPKLPKAKTIESIFRGAGPRFDCISDDHQERVQLIREFIGPVRKRQSRRQKETPETSLQSMRNKMRKKAEEEEYRQSKERKEQVDAWFERKKKILENMKKTKEDESAK
ncbi:MAG: hypothetical protein JXA43_02195 [Candidatus Diapherotrites archaeon]|nr:hypothetical protein [Candidatus Diapherotrites archaeon]